MNKIAFCATCPDDIDFGSQITSHLEYNKDYEMTFAGRLDQILATRKREEKFSGAILIERGEAELFKAAYGYANLPWKIQNRVDTRFRIAPISKMFTAVAVLQLIEQNKLWWVKAL